MITPKHETKNKFNDMLLGHLEGDMHELIAIDKLPVSAPYLPNLSGLHEGQTKGLPTVLKVKKNCPIKITKNINKVDLLVNGTFGWVCDVTEDIIWCIFKDNIGMITRRNCKHKHPQYRNAVPIIRTTEMLNIRVEGKNCSFKRSQFPLTVAYAITCHAAQGITKDRVIIHYDVKDKRHALFSVPFSRAKTLDGVFLSSFKKTHVHCDPCVLEEYERLENSGQYIFKTIYLYDNYFVDRHTGLPSSEELKITF